MPFSENNYAFTVQQSLPATIAILNHNTFYKHTLSRVITTKYFIGQVNDTDFRIIGASAKSPACILSGTLDPIDEQTTMVEIKTSLHKAFLSMFVIWTVLAAAALILPAIIHFNQRLLVSGIVGAVAGAVVFRLALHLFYVIARNKSIRHIESILQ
ncbi:hypothetical protein A0256_23875 [Mucilaginibacter sp. PAMC 26640]|nr:hypothetical protein A0256_23875 [Mucilaginibacter sp. PAMC 26640]